MEGFEAFFQVGIPYGMSVQLLSDSEHGITHYGCIASCSGIRGAISYRDAPGQGWRN